jgi:hypothetical protein
VPIVHTCSLLAIERVTGSRCACLREARSRWRREVARMQARGAQVEEVSKPTGSVDGSMPVDAGRRAGEPRAGSLVR